MALQLPIDFSFRKPNAPLGLINQMSKLWAPKDLILDVKALRELAYRQKFKGPFTLLLSVAWVPILDLLYNAKNSTVHQTPKRIGDVILALPGIKQIMTTDQLGAYQGVLYEI
jgi:hypothetical protein